MISARFFETEALPIREQLDEARSWLEGWD
jgi:hypothetical protein